MVGWLVDCVDSICCHYVGGLWVSEIEYLLDILLLNSQLTYLLVLVSLLSIDHQRIFSSASYFEQSSRLPTSWCPPLSVLSQSHAPSCHWVYLSSFSIVDSMTQLDTETWDARNLRVWPVQLHFRIIN